jgi:hypothetical protein
MDSSPGAGSLFIERPFLMAPCSVFGPLFRKKCRLRELLQVGILRVFVHRFRGESLDIGVRGLMLTQVADQMTARMWPLLETHFSDSLQWTMLD